MPFEIPQQEPQVEVKIGRFQKLADAMLLGCAMTAPWRNALCGLTEDRKFATCAIGALRVGLGTRMERETLWNTTAYTHEGLAVHNAYNTRYGHEIADDNDSGRFTREQIAARIAAL